MANNNPTAPIRQVDFSQVMGKSSMQTTTVEQVLQSAQVQAQQQANRLAELGLKDVRVGSYVRSEKEGR
jgi:hypothetical protein